MSDQTISKVPKKSFFWSSAEMAALLRGMREGLTPKQATNLLERKLDPVKIKFIWDSYKMWKEKGRVYKSAQPFILLFQASEEGRLNITLAPKSKKKLKFAEKMARENSDTPEETNDSPPPPSRDPFTEFEALFDSFQEKASDLIVAMAEETAKRKIKEAFEKGREKGEEETVRRLSNEKFGDKLRRKFNF